MTENSRKRENDFFFLQLRICTHVHAISRLVASKSRLFRLRAKIGCPTFLVYEQLQCNEVYVLQLLYIIRTRANKHTKTSFSRFLVFGA